MYIPLLVATLVSLVTWSTPFGLDALFGLDDDSSEENMNMTSSNSTNATDPYDCQAINTLVEYIEEVGQELYQIIADPFNLNPPEPPTPPPGSTPSPAVG